MAKTEYTDPIAIIGLSGHFPGSTTVAGFFQNVLRKRCFVRDLPAWHWEQDVFYSEDRSRPASTYSRLAALIDEPEPDLSSFRMPPAVAAQLSLNQKLALVCARETLADAGYEQRPFDRARTGVIMAAGAGERGEVLDEAVQIRRLRARFARLVQTPDQHRLLNELWQAYAEAYPEQVLTEDILLGASASLVAGRIASTFDLHALNLTLDAACASSLAAIALGANALRLRTCDMILAGGASTDLTAKTFLGFSKLTALSANGSYPFDARADGFILGEGCAIAVMKRYADALRDGDRIYALIRGWGSSSDGIGKGITAPSSEGQILALERAYEDAGFPPAGLHYLECHGTGTQVGDATELASVSRLVLESGRSVPLPIGSAKAMVGHLTLAAGMAGLFRAILAINSRIVPPQVNFEHPNPNLDWQAARLRVPPRPEPIVDAEVRTGVSGFGFGGVNFHIAISSPPQNRREPLVAAGDFLLPVLPPLANEVAFLFPGQGSQYAGMLAGIGADSESREMLARAEEWTKEIAGASLADLIAPGKPDSAADLEARIRSTAVAQPGIFAHSAILLRKVRAQGIECAMAIGHSLGEYSALHAAGILGYEDALRAVCIRGRLMAALPDSQAGAMAVVGAGPEVVQPLLTRAGGYLVCANLNSYDQTVVSGEPAAVRALQELAAVAGLRCSPLNVERAFHSDWVRPVVAPLRQALEKLDFKTSSIAVPANRSRHVYPVAPAELAGRPLGTEDRFRVLDLLCQQVDHPVDFVAQIELAYESGIRRFVEIGPRNVLTRLVQDILQGKPFQTIALDSAPGEALRKIAGLASQLREPLTVPRRPLSSKPRAALPVAAAKTAEVDESLPPADRVRQVISQVTGYAPAQIGDDAEFERDLGIDTLKIMDIVIRLRGKLLPPRFTSFRQATSVRKILAVAAEAPVGPAAAPPATGKTVTGLKCFRHEITQGGLIPAKAPPRRFQVVPWPQLTTEMAEAIQEVLDPDSPDTVVMLPLPVDPEVLCNEIVPALIERVQERADRDGEFQLVTFAAPEEFRAAPFRSLAGLMKGLQKDAPRLRMAYSHVDGRTFSGTRLRQILAAPALGQHIHADGRIEVGVLSAHPRPSATATLATLLGPQDMVLVTGGARGIAAEVVRHLLRLTAARFVLVGRKPQAEDWTVTEGRGRVEYLVADLSDSDAVRRLELGRRGITLLIHAAGMVKDRPLQKVRREDVAQVLGVKVLGLHRVLAGLDAEKLRGIVNFASISGYFGGEGQPDYAAANAYLDGVEWEKVPVLSIGWSAWDGVGMATTENVRKFLDFAGVEMIPLQAGVAVFAGLLEEFLGTAAPRPQNVVVSAGLAPAICLDRDPLRPTFMALEGGAVFPDAVSKPGVLPVPSELLAEEGARVLFLPLPAAAGYAEARGDELFTVAEREEIEAVGEGKRRSEKRAGKLAAKWLARDVLQAWFQEALEPAVVQVLAPAAPVQVRVPGAPRADAALHSLHFSISHTADWACAAASRRPVGIDVETIRPLSVELLREICAGPVQAQMEACRESFPVNVPPLVVFTQKEAVLKAAGVGIGQGLAAVQLDSFAVGVPVRACFQGAEYRVTSVVVDTHVVSLAVAADLAEPPEVRKEVATSIGQEGLWFQEKMGSVGSAYHFAWQERYRGPLDVEALKCALQHMVERHEVLRTVFREEGGRCLAEVVTVPKGKLTFVDLQSLTGERAQSEVADRCRLLIRQGFDLAAGPLLRSTLFRLTPEDHVLLLVFHHAVMDGFSSVVFRRELAASYGAFHKGEIPALPPLPMQYGEFARLQRERLTAERLEDLGRYWRDQLAGAPEQLELPADRPRPPVQTARAGEVEFPLAPGVMHAVCELAKAEGVTSFVALLAAFQVLLMKLTGQDDLVVGAPFLGREASDSFAMVGYFANILPLRADVSDDPAFRELLHRDRNVVMGALEHQDLPFPKLVELLMPRRNPVRAPLFQVVFRLSQGGGEELALEGLQRESEELLSGGTEFDLTLAVRAGMGSAAMEYNADIFSEATVRAMAERFQQLLEAIARDPDLRLSDIPWLTDAEQDQMLRTWNNTARPVPEKTVHELFAEQAANTPEAIALDGQSGALTYRELNERANRIAHALHKRGVAPGMRVGVALDRSPDLVAALLGILKTGAAYVPLDPEDPPARLVGILDDVRPGLVVTRSDLRAGLPAADVDQLCLDREKAALAGESADNPVWRGNPDDLAYVMFTSGSTGRPKGVAIRHCGIVRLVFGVDYVQLGPAHTLLHMASVSFDASTFELWSALLRGGRCVLLPERVPTLAQLGRTLRHYRVDTLWLTASLFNMVVDEDPSILAGVRQLLTGGEALSVSHVRRALAALPNTQITNGYGPTECTTFACTYRIPRAFAEDAASIPIGQPIANTTAYVLDSHGQPVPPGVPGELHLGGLGLAQGYWNRPELTAERFVANPFDPDPAVRLYKTGDRVRLLPDGNLEFLGRFDQQVKIRGHRVELGEIEAALTRHSGWLQSAVAVREVAPNDKRLVAYIVPADGTPPPSIEEVRGFLRPSLPDYMLPSAVVALDQLPLTPAGKVDRLALPAPANYSADSEGGASRPRNLTEERLAILWEEVLGLERVGIHDNFFDMGGHSLLGVRLITQIRNTFQLDLPMRSLFQAPTIAEQAQLVDAGAGRGPARAYALEIQSGRAGPPLFFVPGGAGGEREHLVYARMMRYLGCDCPIYGFRAKGTDGKSKPHTSAKAMAPDYLAELRAIQPRGPYFLAGECVGGILAFEMARQLRTQGETVALLAMLDTIFPSPGLSAQSMADALRPRLNKRWGAVQSYPKREWWFRIPRAALAVAQEFADDLGWVIGWTEPKPESGGKPLAKRLFQIYIQTLRRYRPQPYNGSVTLLFSSTFGPAPACLRGWQAMAQGGVEVHEVAGNHDTYIRDHAAATGRVLGECRARAHRAHGLEAGTAPDRP